MDYPDFNLVLITKDGKERTLIRCNTQMSYSLTPDNLLYYDEISWTPEGKEVRKLM